MDVFFLSFELFFLLPVINNYCCFFRSSWPANKYDLLRRRYCCCAGLLNAT